MRSPAGLATCIHINTVFCFELNPSCRLTTKGNLSVKSESAVSASRRRNSIELRDDGLAFELGH